MSVPTSLLRVLERSRSHAWCPHAPTAKQSEFLALEDLEALYGGAAGGGKSDALLMAALQHVQIPGYSALLLRRTYSDLSLPGAIMDRAHTWLRGSAANWNDVKKRWTFPSGATIQFGYLDTAKDRYRYQSSEFQFIGFDELTQFDELSYRYLFSRLRRRTDIEVPLRMRAATNPGGIGHDWVKARFIEGDHRFVPARLEDNPHADQVAYRTSLAELDSVTRRQLESGVWEQDAAGLLYQMSDACKIHALPPGPWSYLRALDFGIVDRNAITVLGWRPHDRSTYALSSRYFKGGPAELADELAKDERRFVRTIGDVGGMGKAFQTDIQLRRKIPIEAADKSAKLGAIRLINDDLRSGMLKIFVPECGDLLKEYGSLLRSAKGGEVDGQDNHCADATLYGWRACPSFLERDPGPAKPQAGTPAWEDAEIKRLDREAREETRRGARWLRRVAR